jgi:integrase
MSRQIHRLTQIQVDRARPIEEVVPTSGIRGNDPEKTAADFYRKHGVWPPHVPREPPFDLGGDVLQAMVNAKDRRAEVIAERKFKSALKTMANPSLVMRDGRPCIVKRKTKWLCDGGSLWVKCMPSQTDPDGYSASYVFRYSLPEEITSANGRTYQRQRQMGLGSCNTLTLAEAREKARECRKLLLDGIDPIVARQGQAASAKVAELRTKTFDVVTAEFLMKKGANEGWSAVHSRNWAQSVRDWVSPVIGDVPLADIDTAAAIRALADLWEKHPVTASRVRGRCETIWDFGALHGYVEGACPFRWRGHLEHRFTPPTKVEHLPALPYRDVAAFVRKLRVINTDAARAAEFTIRTAIRTGECLKSRVGDVDRERQLLIIPKANTKTRVEHIVPLPDAAMALLQLDRPVDERLFPIHDSAMLWVIKEINPKIVLHSFRSTFRDFAADCTEFPREIAEACLGHADGTKVELSYRRTTFLEKRARLMQIWSDYLDGITDSANNVVVMAERRA